MEFVVVFKSVVVWVFDCYGWVGGVWEVVEFVVVYWDVVIVVSDFEKFFIWSWDV